MNLPEIIILIFGFIMVIPTIASITKFDSWWVRGFDFPRLQISFLQLLVLVFAFFIFTFDYILQYILVVLVLASFIYQAVKIFPYTVLAKKQVMLFKGETPKNPLSILVSNVLTPNKKYDQLIAHVNHYQPDILLTLESDSTWEKALSGLEKDYPYTVKIPKDNLYGMHLYSKLELLDIEIKYLITDEIPSIHGYIQLKNGKKIRMHCLHPKPPSPTEDDTSTNRDAELLLVAKEVKEVENGETVLVFGDLNDVAWSRTTKLFRKISGLLDPRIGRGLYNTFTADYALLRWPLDHLFHTEDFTLVALHRLKSIGSDHFPIYIKLNYDPQTAVMNEEPEEADKEEKEWAEEKIEDGNPKEKI